MTNLNTNTNLSMIVLKNTAKLALLIHFVTLHSLGFAQDKNPLQWTYSYTSSLNSILGTDSLYQVDSFLLKPIKKLNIRKGIVLNSENQNNQEKESTFFTIDRIELIDLYTDSVYVFSGDLDSPVLLNTYQYHKDIKSQGFDILQFRYFEEKILQTGVPINILPDTLVNGRNIHVIELAHKFPVYLSVDPNIHTTFNVSFKINGQNVNGALVKIGSKIGQDTAFVDFNYLYESTVPIEKMEFMDRLKKSIHKKQPLTTHVLSSSGDRS